MSGTYYLKTLMFNLDIVSKAKYVNIKVQVKGILSSVTSTFKIVDKLCKLLLLKHIDDLENN